MGSFVSSSNELQEAILQVALFDAMTRFLVSSIVAALALCSSTPTAVASGGDVTQQSVPTPLPTWLARGTTAPSDSPTMTQQPTPQPQPTPSSTRTTGVIGSPVPTPAVTTHTTAVAMAPAPNPMATTVPPAPAPHGVGTCYEPMHSPLYPLTGGDGSHMSEILNRDLAQLQPHFSIVRTYHAQFYGHRIADYASKFNLSLYVGLATYPQHPESDALELEAAVEGAKANPGTVRAILVGSEDLVQAGGDQTVDTILARVEIVRQRLQAAGVVDVDVGTAQRINELVNPSIASDMDRLVAACDFVGVNIYPFFTTGFDPQHPAALLEAQWSQLPTRFGSKITKLRVTETGWPSAGSAPDGFPSNIPSPENQRAYFHQLDTCGPHGPTLLVHGVRPTERRSDHDDRTEL